MCEVGAEMSGSIRRHIVREIAVVALANPGCEDYFTMGIFKGDDFWQESKHSILQF